MAQRDRRELFFRETLKLINEKGFKGTTVRDIAEKMGFEAANVYNYFESKDSLLEGYIVSILDEFHGNIDHIVGSTHTPGEKLKLVISKHIRFTLRRPYELGLMVNEWRNLKEPALGEYKRRRDSYIHKIGTIIADGVEIGEFRRMNVPIATNTIVSSLRWSYNRYVGEGRNSVNPVELEKEFIDFIFCAIGSRAYPDLDRTIEGMPPSTGNPK